MSVCADRKHLSVAVESTVGLCGTREGGDGVLNRLMTTEEAADFLNVSYSWLKKAAQRGEVPCTHIGRAVRFSQAHVQSIVEFGERDRSGLRQRSSARSQL